MNRFRRFVRVAASAPVLIRAAALVWAMRLALWCVSFPTVRRVVASLTKGKRDSHPADGVEKLSWAVRVVSRYVPRATCLTQALALHILLRQRGIQSSVRIGVAKDQDGRSEGHAWVLSEDRVVIGDSELGKYTTLLVWDQGTGWN